MPEIVELDQYITPDGETYTFRDDQRRFTMSTTGEGLPPLEFITQRGPFQHGETVIDFRLRPRVLQMVYRERLCTRERYWDARGGATMTTAGGTRLTVAGLLDAIRPNRQSAGVFSPGRLRKLLPGGQKRDLYCFVEQGPGFAARDSNRWDEWAYVEALRFVAHDPVWFDPTQQSTVYTGTIVGGETAILTSIPMFIGSAALTLSTNITYLGTWLSYPTIVVQGPCGSVLIENVTTGEKLDLEYDLLVGDSITFDLSYGQKTVTKQPGALNAVGYLSTDSDLATFHLEPHPGAALGVNDIEITVGGNVGDTAYVSISHYRRYVGI